MDVWTEEDKILYRKYVAQEVCNLITVDGCEPTIEPVWSIQKDQRDLRFTAEEHKRYIKYRQYVSNAMPYIAQSNEVETERYNHWMSMAIGELKNMYKEVPANVYTFTCGKKTFRCQVPGTPVYVTESNCLSRYLRIGGREYYVFWTSSGRYNIAYVNTEIRDEFNYICALVAFDFTCQTRTTLADDLLAFVPCKAPDEIKRVSHPGYWWLRSQDGLSNSGTRQLVSSEEVVIRRRSLTLMGYGLSQNVFTYAHKIGVMMWLNSTDDAQLLYVWSGLTSAESRRAWVETAKETSLAIKPIIRLAPHRLCKLVEADSLANRHEEDELDWNEEKVIRTTPVDNLIPVSYIYSEAFRIFKIKRANNVRPRRQNADDFIMELPMTIPEGAWYEPLKARSPKLRSALSRAGMSDNVAGSKAIHILNCRPNEIKFLLSKDRVDVKTQVKVEWSKLRALYPTDVASNLQCAFVAGEVEKYLPANCLIGAGYSDEVVERMISSYERSGYGISAGQDYKGFNEQHKKESMKAVMQAWLDVFGRDLHPDQLKTMNTIRDNFDRHYIKFPDGSTVKLEDTLMSGSRWTTFLNTMFNHIYSKFIHHAAGVRAVTFHVGDDVYGRYKTLDDAEKVIYVANRLNVHMQVKKCFVYGSSEFLRKQYIGTSHYQYLCRSIATLVHSRWEREEPVRLKDRLNGLYTRMLNFLERGGEEKCILWHKMVRRIIGDRTITDKIKYMLSLPSSQGGVRSEPKRDTAWVKLLKDCQLWMFDEDALIIDDHEATSKLYRKIESLPLIGYSAARILWVSNLGSKLINKMKAFLSHRFTTSTKFDNTRLVIDHSASSRKALARYVALSPGLESDYTRVHPYVRAMHAARRRGMLRRWFLNTLG